MDSTTRPFTIQLPDDVPFAFRLQALVERLQTLTVKRKARGIRYQLDVLLLIAVLARLAGYRRLEPVADWARLRAAVDCTLLTRPGCKDASHTWCNLFHQEEQHHAQEDHHARVQAHGRSIGRGR